MKGFLYLKNVATLKVDQSACTGCGRCAEVCPHQVFTIDGGLATVTDLDACMECGACNMNCAASAITVDAGVGCATGLINEWLAERHILKTGGDCCS